MIHHAKKTACGLGIIISCALTLSACDTLNNTASGVEHTAYDAGKTVKSTAVGAEKDINAMTKSTSKHQMMGDDNHEPAG